MSPTDLMHKSIKLYFDASNIYKETPILFIPTYGFYKFWMTFNVKLFVF